MPHAAQPPRPQHVRAHLVRARPCGCPAPPPRVGPACQPRGPRVGPVRQAAPSLTASMRCGGFVPQDPPRAPYFANVSLSLSRHCCHLHPCSPGASVDFVVHCRGTALIFSFLTTGVFLHLSWCVLGVARPPSCPPSGTARPARCRGARGVEHGARPA
jgi:hypothetical protein